MATVMEYFFKLLLWGVGEYVVSKYWEGGLAVGVGRIDNVWVEECLLQQTPCYTLMADGGISRAVNLLSLGRTWAASRAIKLCTHTYCNIILF